jgi:hypothetical protein
MRFAAVSIALIVALKTTDIERAQQVARAPDAERSRFHRPYVVMVNDATFAELEAITPFRRMVLITEDHLRRGDWMFSRSTRAGEDALAPFRELVTLVARARFSPLNTYLALPALSLAIGSPGSALDVVDTRTTPQNGPPTKGRFGVGAQILGATLEADVPASTIRGAVRAVGLMLDGKTVAQATLDFGRLD